MKETSVHRVRIKIAASLIFAFILACVLKAFWLQVIVADKYSKKALSEIITSVNVPAKRGQILDRNGKVLAMSIDVASVYANPHKILNKTQTAKEISKILKVEESTIMAALESSKPFVWIKRSVSPYQAEQIMSLKIEGIGIIKEYARFYPNKELASQTIGFVNIDNKGIEGIEKVYDDVLTGPEKKIILMKDARGKGFAVVKEEFTEKRNFNIYLTIDRELQQALEIALKNVVETRKAISANAVLMDCNTGEILAIATYPSYNPNNFKKYDAAFYRNRSITDVYEPGSIMKPFVFAAALEKNLISPMTIFDCEHGKYPIAGKIIKDVQPYGALTAEGVIVKSSNIGSLKMGERLGYENFYNFLKKLGFGSPLGIELPGERSGYLRPPQKIRKIEEVNTYFGQGVTVTTLQMVAGMAALVNGGYVVRPHVVKELKDERGKVVKPPVLVEGERLLNQKTSDIVKGVLEKVTTEGTGTKARIPLYTVGGKTGTAQKVDPNTRSYAPGKYISSFIGFAPVEYPRYVLGVVVDEPKGEYYGGVVAAPVFSQICSAALAHTGVSPSVPRPIFANKDNVLKQEGLLMESCLTMAQDDVLPDFTGMSIREVLNTTRLLKLPVEVKGSGFAVYQDPKPGLQLSQVKRLVVEFRPPHEAKGG